MNPYITISIVIIILIVYLSYNVSTYEEYMYGLYVADSDFCASAEISSMLIFIGEPLKGWFSTTRPCYIVICDDITNQSFTINYRRGWGGPSIGEYNINSVIEFDSEDIFETNGESVTFSFDMTKGSLKIFKGDNLYGKLYKQADISDLLTVSEDSSEIES
jgi:hypothetical protein